MEGRCKDCDFWTAVKGTDLFFDNCPEYKHRGACSCKSFVYAVGLQRELPKDWFVYGDFAGKKAYFEPCSHFGCIHFKARP